MKNSTILVFSFLLLTLTILSAKANDTFSKYPFQHIDVSNGLSENNVKSIIQDHWGFMWFGTKNGLNRYDGNSIKHFDVDDKIRRHSNHNVSALYEDQNHNLWIGTDKGVFIYNPYSETFTYFDLKTNNGEQITNWISQIVSDHEGNIWIVAPDEGAFRYNTHQKKLFVYRTAKNKTYVNNPECICIRKNGEVWLGTNGAGIYNYDRTTGKLTQVLNDKYGTSLEGINIYAMTDYGNWIVIGEHEQKLMKYNPSMDILTEVGSPNVHYKIIRTILFNGKNLLVGTQNGLYIIDEKKNSELCIQENDMLPNSLSDNMIYALYQDRQEGIWIGTMQSGVNYIPANGMQFYNYVPLRTAGSLSSKRIRDMICTQNGDVWIATEEGYLNIFHPATQTFKNISTPLQIQRTNRLALMQNGNEVWSGLFKNGLDVIDISSHRATHYSPSDLHLKSEGSVYALFKDSKNRIWLGTGNGLYLKSQGMKFERIGKLASIFCQDITEDQQGNIWIATIGSGVFCYNPRTHHCTNYLHNDDNPKSLSSNDVSSITIDAEGNIWFSTDRGGICRFDHIDKSFTSYSKNEGLPDDVAYKILEDQQGRLWFGTNQGLVRFDPQTKDILVYRNTNGLLSNQYNYKSAVKASDGMFLFGGTSGLVSFYPQLSNTKRDSNPIYITNIRVNNEEIKPADKYGILKKSIIHSTEIKLPYDFSSLSLDISSLNYSGTERTNYEYMLMGVDNKWNLSTTGIGINYSRLQPGIYTLKIRNANSDNKVTLLRIIVRHPWWSSTWAMVVYLLLGMGLIYYLITFFQKRQQKMIAAHQQRLQEVKDKELLQAKVSFFTDITHEIRTPLTLINGSLDSIEQNVIEDKNIRKGLSAIQKNTKRLLNLINQLLDFRKMDSNCMMLNFTRINICKLVKEVIERFEPFVNNTNKTISLDLEEEDIMAPVDQEAVTKIISNLLNNACKYSETFIQCAISRGKYDIFINIQNDGAKIPQEKAEEIFKPFTRLNSNSDMLGSGIGLSLARSLADLHHGSITLDTLSEYNSFTLRLPLEQQNVIEIDDYSPAELPLASTSVNIDDYVMANRKDKQHTVLIVEDNIEILEMLINDLSPYYNVITANNGMDGLRKTKYEHIDLIISDVLMPKMDGMEMTRIIKDDIEVNHIPIILLTALHTLDHRLTGLKAGADAYIEKPFSLEHLLTQVETLLVNRKREMESFLHKPYLPMQNTKINKAEEVFLNKISGLIIQNIDNPNFNVEHLAIEMCMSRSSLHRKIKEVSNLTPIDFIRLIKLKKAAELIKEYGYRSSEVCDMIGFNSPSYFIKVFQKQFGVTPKEFASGKTPIDDYKKKTTNSSKNSNEQSCCRNPIG